MKTRAKVKINDLERLRREEKRLHLASKNDNYDCRMC